MKLSPRYFLGLIVSAVCGSAFMFAWLMWYGQDSNIDRPSRLPEIVLSDLSQARAVMSAYGVYWFSGSKTDAEQLEALSEALEPSSPVVILHIDGFEGFALVNTAHEAFGNGNMSIGDVEKKLIELIPSE